MNRNQTESFITITIDPVTRNLDVFRHVEADIASLLAASDLLRNLAMSVKVPASLINARSEPELLDQED